MNHKLKAAIDQGRNVFVTGAAGTGKSYTIREIKEKYPHACMTSTTGASSILIRGITFHSMSGMQIGKDNVQTYINKIMKNYKQKTFIKGLKIVIVDECSMLNAKFWEKVDKVFRAIRGVDKPFGGIQMILSGDFFQLPPINSKYLFETDLWWDMEFYYHILTDVKRQTDKAFINMLGDLRKGKMTEEAEMFLRSRMIQPEDDYIVRLYPHKKDAEVYNKEMLDKIDEPEHDYVAKMASASIKITDNQKEVMFAYMSENMPAPPIITLKKGCQVLYLRNDKDKKLVNGSQGIVVGFMKSLPVVKFSTCEIVVSPYRFETEDKEGNIYYYDQLPLIVCWARSIHKSQGQTLEKGVISIGEKIFENHQAYVALSRISSPDGVYIENFDPKSFKICPRVLKFYNYIESL